MRPVRLTLIVAIVLIAGCQRVFKPADFQTHEALYQATMREYERGKWDNAVLGFERLTIDLPARDTLLPLAHYYQTDGFWPQLWGLVPVLLIWIVDSADLARWRRLTLIAAMRIAPPGASAELGAT